MLTPGRDFWRLLFLDKLYPRASYPVHRWDTENPRRVEVLNGACLMLRRAALDEVGLLDEQYFMYTEEIDLCFRLGKAGWEIWYVPTAVLTHYQGASSSKVRERMYIQLYRSKVQFYRKTGGEQQARLFKVLMLLAYAPRVAMQPHHRTYRRLMAELPWM